MFYIHFIVQYKFNEYYFSFRRFLFLSLLNYYPDLAYEVGLRAMRLPVLEEHEDSDDPMGGNPSSSLIISRYPRWFTLGHIETQQCALSSTMLSAAKGKIICFQINHLVHLSTY